MPGSVDDVLAAIEALSRGEVPATAATPVPIPPPTVDDRYYERFGKSFPYWEAAHVGMPKAQQHALMAAALASGTPVASDDIVKHPLPPGALT